VINFDEHPKADHLLVVFLNGFPTHQSPADIYSAVACLEVQETTTVPPTTSHPPTTLPTGTTPHAVTTGVPQPTTVHQEVTTGVPSTTLPAAQTTAPTTTTTARHMKQDPPSFPEITKKIVVPPTSKPTCLQKMPNQGIVPKDQVTVSEKTEKDFTRFTITSKKPQDTNPTWVGVVFFVDSNVKEVTFLPADKTGTPRSAPQSKKPEEGFLPALLDKPTEAYQIIVLVVPVNPGQPYHAELVAAVACFASEETTTAQTTTHVAPTTGHIETTVGTTTHATTIHLPKLLKPCEQQMKDGGIIKSDELHVTHTESKEITVVTVDIPHGNHKEPEWAAVNVKVNNVKVIQYTPVDKNGKEGHTETKPVLAGETTIVLGFVDHVKAEKIVVKAVPATPSSPAHVEVVSVKACVEKLLSCLKHMQDGGVIKKEHLTVEHKDNKITVAPQKKPKETPQWDSITLTPSDVKEVHFVAVKDNKPIGKAEVKHVTDHKKPIILVFKHSVTADQLLVLLVPSKPGQPTHAEVISVMACIQYDEPTTVHTTLPTTVQTTHAVTTVATTTVATKVQCTKNMKDQGLVPGHKLTVEKKDDHTTVVKPSTSQPETPQWVKIIASFSEPTTVKFSAVDKNGTPVKDTKTQKVDQPKKSVPLVFDAPVTADHVVLTVEHGQVEVHHAVACLSNEETTTQLPTTTPHPSETTYIAGTTGHPSETTRAAQTTPAVPTTIAQKVQCPKNMKDQGLVPEHSLTVIPIHDLHSTTLIVKPTTPQKDTPQWTKVTFTPTDAKEVKVTPVDKKGNPAGDTVSKTPTDDKKPTVVEFPKPIEADHLVIVVLNRDDAHPSHADILHAVACLDTEETTTVHPSATTTPHPAETTAHLETTHTTPHAVFTTTVPTKVQCSKGMKDTGLVPNHKLTTTVVSDNEHHTVLVVKPSGHQRETPEFVKIVLTPINAKFISAVPLGKNGKPVEPATSTTPHDTKKNVEIVFEHPVKAESVKITVVYHIIYQKPGKHQPHSPVEVLHVVACVKQDTETTQAAGTTVPPTTPHPSGTTAPVPPTTQHPSGTTQHPAETTVHVTTPVTTPAKKEQCSKGMKDEGLVPGYGLTLTTTAAVLIVKPTGSHTSQPEWIAITLSTPVGMFVVAKPVDKKGNMSGPEQIIVLQNTKKTEIVFHPLVKADAVELTVKQISGSSQPLNPASVLHAIVCVHPHVEETTQHVATTTSVPGVTSVTTPAPVITTTVVIPPPHMSPPCMKNMKNNGVVTKDQLSVVEVPGKDTTALSISPQTPGKETPQWVSLVFTVGVKDVTYTLVSQDGKQITSPRTEKTDATKPAVVMLDSAKAYRIVAYLTPVTPGTHVGFVHAVACFIDEPTTPHTTIQVPTTAGIPATTGTTYQPGQPTTVPTTVHPDQTTVGTAVQPPTTKTLPQCTMSGEVTLAQCRPSLTCDLLKAGKTIADLPPMTGPCCACAAGLIRDTDGHCVPEKACTCTDSDGSKHPIFTAYTAEDEHRCQETCVFSHHCEKKCVHMCEKKCAPGYKLITPEGQCCQCVKDVAPTCSGVMNGVTYTKKEGETWTVGQCIHCKCEVGKAICAKTCDKTTCAKGEMLNLFASDASKCCACTPVPRDDVTTTPLAVTTFTTLHPSGTQPTTIGSLPTTTVHPTGMPSTTPETKKCTDGEIRPLNECMSMICEQGKLLPKLHCNKKCSETQVMVQVDEKSCCQCVERSTLTNVTQTPTTGTPTPITMCKAPLVFTTCMKTCSMCHFLKPNCVPSTECHTGCDCPGNLVYNGETCVTPADCKCVVKNPTDATASTILKPGETKSSATKACTEHICIDNKLVDKPKACKVCDPNKEKTVMVEGECCPTCQPLPPPKQSEPEPVCTGGKIPTKCLCTETCETKAMPNFKCPTGEACRKGCQCVEGYVEDINGACIKAASCGCYEPVTGTHLALNEAVEKKNPCGSTTHHLCTKNGLTSVTSCQESCKEDHIPAKIDEKGCCVCVHKNTTTPTTPKPEECKLRSIVCDLPCDSPADLTCAKFSQQPESVTKGHLKVVEKNCKCPETYVPEVVPTGTAGSADLYCVKKSECYCMHGGKKFTSGEMFSDLTPAGKPIECRTCTCMNGKVQCHDVPNCLVMDTTTMLPSTTTIPAKVAELCATTGCFENNVCHKVNDTWSKANCVSCKCTAPRTTVCR
jgi:hypothetical protein